MNPTKCTISVWVIVVLLASFSAAPACAQSASGQQPASNSSATNEAFFSPLPLPAPNSIRTVQGIPGHAYWQQRADYHITASLYPDAHRISGTVRITYTNNSPHTLHQLWLQLDQNAFSPQSRSARIQGQSTRWRGSFTDGGFTISDVYTSRLGSHSTPSYIIDDTRLRIDLDAPLPPGGSTIDISITYSFIVPDYGADRTGRTEVERGTIYQIAQWYPRMYVFDDVSGWNAMPYLGQGEFYLEYGDYTVEISVPSDFFIVATGKLVNPEEVYTRDQQKRMDQAQAEESVVSIIKDNEVGKRNTRPNDSDTLTWVFKAENVRDFAWAASQAFIVDAANANGVLIMSAYPHEALGVAPETGWEKSTEYLRHSIQFYSDMWYAYPYPVAINVAGIVSGMEYPMIQFCSLEARDQALFGVTDHEAAHNWFPMLVGSDERRHAWMDEGFTTFMSYYSLESYPGEQAERLIRYKPTFIADRMVEPSASQPIMTHADALNSHSIGFLAYRKPGAGLILLREYILGPERFDEAFKFYITSWENKHPQPADFMRLMEQHTGEQLAWFWSGWFYGTDPLDQEVFVGENDQNEIALLIRHNTELLLPMDILVQYNDGRVERSRIGIEHFLQDNALVLGTVESSIQRLVIDPDEVLPDIDRSNNVWMNNR